MKKFLYVLLFFFIGAVVVIAGFVGFLQIRGIPKYPVEKFELTVVSDSAKIAHGAKIASVQCIVCHRGQDGKLSGRFLNELPPDFGKIYSANITQHKQTGIGGWSDGDIYYLLRTGVKPDGQYLPPYMPKFPHMSEYDMQSVIAWLRSDRPEVQPSEVNKVLSEPSLLTKFLCLVQFKNFPINKAPITEPDTNDLVNYGRYLIVGRYDCYPCHSADFKTLNQFEPEKTGGYMGGGNRMVSLDGKERLTANLTPHKTGIGDWTEGDFRNAMLFSKSKNGQSLRDPMLPYNGLTDLEIKAMWKYLLSLAPIDNNVNRNWDEE